MGRSFIIATGSGLPSPLVRRPMPLGLSSSRRPRRRTRLPARSMLPGPWRGFATRGGRHAHRSKGFKRRKDWTKGSTYDQKGRGLCILNRSHSFPYRALAIPSPTHSLHPNLRGRWRNSFFRCHKLCSLPILPNKIEPVRSSNDVTVWTRRGGRCGIDPAWGLSLFCNKL